MAPPVLLIPPRGSCSTPRAVSTGHSERRPHVARYSTMPIDWTTIERSETVGEELHDLIRELYPIPRSLTGDGVRETLAVLGRDLPLDVVETPSGTEVFDWVVPREWNVRDAWIEAPDGRCLARFEDSSLNLLGYSVPVDLEGRARRAARARLHGSPESRSRPVPHVVLGGEMGVLHDPARGRLASRRRVPCVRRLDARGRLAHVWRGSARRLEPAHGVAHDDGLPSGARQRQPVRDRADGGARARARDAEAPAQLPARLEPGDDRAPLLAPPQPRARRGDHARACDLVCGRPGRDHLQAESAR